MSDRYQSVIDQYQALSKLMLRYVPPKIRPRQLEARGWRFPSFSSAGTQARVAATIPDLALSKIRRLSLSAIRSTRSR